MQSTVTEIFDGPPAKLADTLPGVHELIRARWSPRSFSSRDISDRDLKTILDAARWAASSNNEQPWRFLVARKSDAAAFEKLLNLLVPANQAWAKAAPVLMIMASKRTFSPSGSPNRFAMHDTGQALAHVFLQATALGLHAHGMAGFDAERARKDLHIPDDYELGAAVALGYLAPPDQLPERYRDGEISKRQRKPLNELVFGADWNQPVSSLISSE
ncbi:MAG: nitroreductase family protein [Acidobacteriaceae bacterium]|nr:nitroreductase family protein [Acidobacteriaceae bacterium]MBV9781636.1 nitroreductase family protein [Acidobacteriaceae bacterium]